MSSPTPSKKQLQHLNGLAWRNLAQHRTRTVLSILAIALGVAMTIAGNMTGRSVINSLSSAEEVQAIIRGLLDQFNMMLTLIGVAITAAAWFIIFNAFMMSITQRRQQIGALRSSLSEAQLAAAAFGRTLNSRLRSRSSSAAWV